MYLLECSVLQELLLPFLLSDNFTNKPSNRRVEHTYFQSECIEINQSTYCIIVYPTHVIDGFCNNRRYLLKSMPAAISAI